MVTVITATYNLLKAGREEYFRQCVESVHTQNYPNIEHIIIDGASTDGTLSLLSEYEQKGWIKVYSESDKGIYDAFNKGLHKAKGKYIAFLNSDDMWHDSRGVENSVKILEEEAADFSYSSIIFLSGKRKRYLIPFISSFFCGTPFCHQTMFTRTKLLQQIGGFNLSYEIFADGDVIARLILGGAKAAYVSLCFTTFRDCGFANKCDTKTLLYESRAVYAQLYKTYATDSQINHILERRLTTPFKNLLTQKIHPEIAKELNRHCQWNRWEKIWYYQAHQPACCVLMPIVYALNHLLPGWYSKLRWLYHHCRSLLMG